MNNDLDILIKGPQVPFFATGFCHYTLVVNGKAYCRFDFPQGDIEAQGIALSRAESVAKWLADDANVAE